MRPMLLDTEGTATVRRRTHTEHNYCEAHLMKDFGPREVRPQSKDKNQLPSLIEGDLAHCPLSRSQIAIKGHPHDAQENQMSE